MRMRMRSFTSSGYVCVFFFFFYTNTGYTRFQRNCARRKRDEWIAGAF
jgi:hypothetical protein